MTKQTLTQEAAEAKREYMREYYRKNKKKLLEQRKEWARNNKDKVAAANQRYWEKRAKQLDQQKNA